MSNADRSSVEAEPSRGLSRDGGKRGFANFWTCAAQRAALQMLPASRCQPAAPIMLSWRWVISFFIYHSIYLFIYFYRYVLAAAGSLNLALVYTESREAPSPCLTQQILRPTWSKWTAIYFTIILHCHYFYFYCSRYCYFTDVIIRITAVIL